MSAVLGEGWHTFEWFHTEAERASRIAELTAQFAYYRRGDRATYVIEKIQRDPDQQLSGHPSGNPRRPSHG